MKCSFGCMRIHSEKAHVCSFLLPVTLSYFGDLVKALIFQVRWKIYYSFPFMGKRNKKARVVFFFFFFSFFFIFFFFFLKHFFVCAFTFVTYISHLRPPPGERAVLFFVQMLHPVPDSVS